MVKPHLIVGLGNPGDRYQHTRHNIGFDIVDTLADRWGFKWKPARQWESVIAEGDWNGIRVILLKPQTFMNLSGRAVAAVARFNKIEMPEMIVAHDDVDVDFGRIKVKVGGGAAGHNGLKSIIGLMSPDFMRLRAGIGRSTRDDLADYVLSRFDADERKRYDDFLKHGADAIEYGITHGYEKAMTVYNGKNER